MRNILLLAILIAVSAAFFASTHPDGLEQAAEHLGFGGTAIERSSVMTDYTCPFVARADWSTAAAGIIGIFICWSLFWAAAKIKLCL